MLVEFVLRYQLHLAVQQCLQSLCPPPFSTCSPGQWRQPKLGKKSVVRTGCGGDLPFQANQPRIHHLQIDRRLRCGGADVTREHKKGSEAF